MRLYMHAHMSKHCGRLYFHTRGRGINPMSLLEYFGLNESYLNQIYWSNTTALLGASNHVK